MVGTSRGPYLLPQNLCSYSAHNSYANISHNYFYHQYEIPEQWRWVPGTVREFVRSKQTSYSWLDHSQEQAFQSMRKPKMMTHYQVTDGKDLPASDSTSGVLTDENALAEKGFS